jgi:hypothetical protein
MYTLDEQCIIAEVKRDIVAGSRIAQQCSLISFVSYSKGKGRKRNKPILITLLRYNGRCRQLVADWCPELDIIAREITGLCDTASFLRLLRSIERMKRND